MTDLLRSLVILSGLGLGFVGNAWAQNLQVDPNAACDFLAAEGLRTRGYRANGDIHECRSQRRNLVSGGRVNNSIRFVARGDAQNVMQLTLELQVNSTSAVQRAHRQLVDHSKALMKTVLGTAMPEEIEAAILSATSGTWSVEGTTITLERIVLGGAGYELRFRIR